MTNPDPKLRLPAAAKFLGVCPQTVRRFCAEDGLPFLQYNKPGGKRDYRFKVSDLEEFLESRRRVIEQQPLQPRQKIGNLKLVSKGG